MGRQDLIRGIRMDLTAYKDSRKHTALSQEKLDKQIEEFLAKGGEIEQVENGASGATHGRTPFVINPK